MYLPAGQCSPARHSRCQSLLHCNHHLFLQCANVKCCAMHRIIASNSARPQSFPGPPRKRCMHSNSLPLSPLPKRLVFTVLYHAEGVNGWSETCVSVSTVQGLAALVTLDPSPRSSPGFETWGGRSRSSSHICSSTTLIWHGESSGLSSARC